MEIDDNKVGMTLDEIIQLNKMKNSLEDEEEEECLPVSKSEDVKDLTLLSENEREIEERLRMNPNYGKKPIHHRLGYINARQFKRPRPPVYSHKFKGHWFDHSRKKSVFNAMKTLMVKGRLGYGKKIQPNPEDPFNPIVKFPNPYFKKPYSVSPLTRNSLKSFNQMNGCRERTSEGSRNSVFSMRHSNSVFSMRTTSSLQRHSMTLNPLVSQALKNILAMSAKHYDLDGFSFVPTKTMYTLDERVSMYNK